MASKNIVAKGTTYNGVESVTFPVSGGGNATFYEISDTTCTASDVLNSKYFYSSSGVKTQGTGTVPSPTLITKNITANGTYNASSDNADGYSSVTVSVSGGGGGGSGLVFEQGTWTPSVDTVDTWLNFTDTHTEAPFYYMITDESGTELTTDDTMQVVIYSNYGQLFGDGYIVGNTIQYGIVVRRFRNGVNSTSGTTGMLLTPYTSTASSTNTDSRFWATETGIRAYYGADYYCTWRANRTYKWIAVWKPTT